MRDLSDWLIAGSVTLVVGATSSFLIPGGRTAAALLGSTSGAVVGAAISSKRQQEKLIRLKELEKQVVTQEEWLRIKAELPSLREIVKQLREAQAKLATVEEQFVHKQVELQQVDLRLTTLTERVEKLKKIEKDLAVFEGEFIQKQAQLQEVNEKLSSLTESVAELRKLQRNLATVEGQFVQKQAELEAADLKLTTLTERVKELQKMQTNLVAVEGQLAPKQVQLQEVNQRLANLAETVAELRKAQTDLATVEGQFIQKQAELQQVEQRLTNLNQQKQELEQRIAVINQQQPNLSNLEQLQQQIEQFKLNKSALEGQANALSSQINSLETQKRSLHNVEAEFATKTAKLQALNQQIQVLQTKSQQLEQQVVELEFLRSTYDALFSQKQSFEERVNQLRPEIDRLEAEKQRILRAIQQNQQEYQKVDELRQRVRNLNIQIREKESDLKEREADIQRSNRVKADLEEKNACLQQEKEQLQDEIKRLEGEIENQQNSAEVALRSLKEPLWVQSKLPSTRWSIDNTSAGEQQFLQGFIRYIKSEGLAFPGRVVHSFHTSLKVQDISALVILAGISGTGKSELPQRYADYIGAQLLTLAVQPRWDSPQDLQGFYNYVEKKFKPTDLMRGLYQYNDDPTMTDRIVIVLLDEMNLARVEYYFSDFLSKLETRRSHPTSLEIDVGSLALEDKKRRLEIPKEFLFVGTMNEDETTQSLSDKVLDRANVITFGKPQNLQLRRETPVQNGNGRASRYLSYSGFDKWIRKPEQNSEVVEWVKSYLDQTNQVMERMGHPFAHRVYQSITKYVVNYPGVESIDSAGFKFALADQFGQKLLPKLRGVMIDEVHEELDALENIIKEIGDRSLSEAFRKARNGRFGQFQWQGLVYQDEPVK